MKKLCLLLYIHNPICKDRFNYYWPVYTKSCRKKARLYHEKKFIVNNSFKNQYPISFFPFSEVKSKPGRLKEGGLSSPLTTVVVPKSPVSPLALLTLPLKPSSRSGWSQYSLQFSLQYTGSCEILTNVIWKKRKVNKKIVDSTVPYKQFVQYRSIWWQY